MPAHDQSSFAHQIQRIETLVQDIERSPDAAAREKVREIVRAVLDLHAAGLKRICDVLSESNGEGGTMLDACLNDDLVRSLLLLHDLHPTSLEQRIRAALDRARPYLRSHGGDVELLEVSAASVRLKMEGSCHGCPSSAATLRDTIERAILETAPDVLSIEVEGLSAPGTPGGLVSLELPPGVDGAPRNNMPAGSLLAINKEN